MFSKFERVCAIWQCEFQNVNIYGSCFKQRVMHTNSLVIRTTQFAIFPYTTNKFCKIRSNCKPRKFNKKNPLLLIYTGNSKIEPIRPVKLISDTTQLLQEHMPRRKSITSNRQMYKSSSITRTYRLFFIGSKRVVHCKPLAESITTARFLPY